MATGPVGAVVATLLDIGWKPHGPKNWEDPEGTKWIAEDELGDNPDFSERSLRSNVVLRWEYRPGSTFFLVWSQSRSHSPDRDDPGFAPLAGVRDSFTDEGQNIFLAKFNYWLGI